MTDVMFYSFHNTAPWWKFLADNLNFTQSACVVSDIRGDGDICIVDSFYNNMRDKDCAKIASQHFSEVVCEDIIRRCRVLRNLKKTVALAMIGAMWLAFDEVIRNERPKLVMSFIIDRYVLDILERVAKSYHIPFLGMTASIIPEYVMFMDRGKLINLRDPEQNEVERSRTELLNESFTPSYVSNSKKFSLMKYWRTFIYFKTRGLVFNCIRYLKRDRLNLHYLDALNHLEHKPRLLDFKALNYIKQDWESSLAKTGKEERVFLAMQLLPEASLDYWIDDLALLDNEQIVIRMCKVLVGAGHTVFIKDHPLQFGFRKRAIFQKLAALPGVILVPYSTPANRLIKECSVSITFTGTIGFQSAVAGCCSIVSGAYYSDEQHFIHFHSLSDITLLPEKIRAYKEKNKEVINEKDIDQLLTKVLAASAPGDLFSFKQFNKDKPEHVKKTATLINSLNKYLPQFLKSKMELT